MKKYLMFVLILALALSCAACSSGDGADADQTDQAVQSAAAEVTEIGSTEDDPTAPVLVSEETGEGFPCLVLDNGECYWAVGLTTPTEVETYYSIKSAPRAYIQFIPISYTDDPVTEDDAVWQMQVVGDEIPDWFLEDETMWDTAWDAMEQWRLVAYTEEGVTVADNETIAIAEETGEGFACVLRKNGMVFWEYGVNYPSELVTLYELEDVSKLLFQVVQIGDEFETDSSWQIQIIGDEIPTWFSSIESMEFNVRDALGDWKQMVLEDAEE